MRRLLPAALVGGVGIALVTAGLALGRPATAPPRADESAPVVAAATLAPVATPTSTPAPTPAPTASPQPTPVTLGEGWRIKLARLSIDLVLRDGDTARDVEGQRTPEGAAYSLPGTALPGAAGNAYVYGHARAGQFLSLWSVRIGDLVEVDGPNGVLSYRVAEIHPRVAITDLRYLLPSNDERLTLQTSTGPNATDPRFVVVALPER